ncbi:uncharacterized protein [Henckelia pumila]|uniref:uncharacterized protein n=1 Tax=Henckelia pumila TaxID=405737 RepID=UPI003C6E5EF9
MIEWLHVTLIAVSAVILLLILVLILRRCFRTRTNAAISDDERGQSLQSGISRLHQMNHDLERDASKKTNYYALRHGVSAKKPIFSWADHPSLITDAVENGWSRFAFTTLISSPSVKSAKSLLGVCAAGDPIDVEIGWEVCEGSADFMQKIRLNHGCKKSVASVSSMGVTSVIRTALPLPGPHLGNSSFPQEAYFEITILSCNENIRDHLVDKERKDKSEGEKIKLIGEDFNAKMNSDSSNIHVSGRNKIEDTKLGGKKDVIFLSVGFTGGATVPLKIPGSYHGSIGFNSSGSVYLDGMKLVFDSGKEDWVTIGKVIGCGFNPSQKKVFFTCDSQLVHEIHCKTEEFSSPLYPTMAANTDITVLVNLGQSPFKFLPGNRHRTPNPCFIGPMLGNSPSLGYDDSRELFSMGRIDSQWLQRSAMIRSNNNTVNSIKSLEYDMESEGDLFEIVLDSTGRSPYASAHQ